MSTVCVVWRAHTRSVWNAARSDGHYRIGLVVLLLFGIGAAALSTPRLAALLERWQAAGTLPMRVWLVCASAWLSVGVLALLNTPPLGFGMPEAHVLWMVPLTPATRFRALWVIVALEGWGSGLVLVAGVVGGSLVAALGWQALAWVWVVLAGCGVAAWCGIAALLAARTATGWRRWILFPTLALVAVVLAAGTMGNVARAVGALQPVWIGAAFSAMLLLLLGPFAAPLGRLYERAFVAALRRDRTSHRVYVPGVLHLSRSLLARRTLAGALLRKGVLSRGRSTLNLVRFAAPVVYLALFPWISSIAAQHGLNASKLIGVVATKLVLGVVSETVPSPLGGEGNRIALLLAAPLPHRTILWAKWTAFVVPVGGYGVVLGAVLGMCQGLAIADLSTTLIGITVVLVGNAALWVWGSAWDIDLHATVVGPEQTMLVEELPLTPQRMGLVGSNFLFAGAAWLVLWWLPPIIALALLVVVDLIVYTVTWQCGLLALRRLPR